MKHVMRGRAWGAFGTTILFAHAAAAQMTVVDVGTDQPTPPVNSTTAPALRPQPVSVSPTEQNEGDAVQVHAARVASLMGLSRAMSLACTTQAPDVDKALLERATIRAISLGKGLGELEQREKQLRQEVAKKPNDPRLRVELNTVIGNRQRLQESATREVSGKLGDAARAIASLRTALCTELCTAQETPASPVNLCAFASPALANAAAISDDESVRALATYVTHRFDAVRIVLSPKQAIRLSDIALAEPGISPVFGVADAASRVLDVQHTGLDVAAFSMGALDVGIRAMASLIVDRAKQESMVWFLRRLQDDVCGDEAAARNPDFREIRSHWFPTTCALAGGPVEFMQYGRGDLMQSLRGAIAADVSNWHAAALGLGMGSTLWSDTNFDANLFACDSSATAPVTCDPAAADRATCEFQAQKQLACAAGARARMAGATLAKNLAFGANASLALYNFASDIDRLNKVRLVSSAPKQFFSDRLELFACAAAMPEIFQEYGDLVRQTKPGRVEETKALILAALTSSPACFSIVGRGFSRDRCAGFSETGAEAAASVCPSLDPTIPLDVHANAVAAIQATGRIEKLSTMLRWSKLVDVPARDLTTRWVAVVDAYRAYRHAAEELAKAPIGANVSVPPVDLPSSEKVTDALRAATLYAENAARLAERTPKLRVARAGLVLARSSLDLATAFLSSTEQVLGTEVAIGTRPGMFSQWYEPDPGTGVVEIDNLGGLVFPGFGRTSGFTISDARKTFAQSAEEIARLSRSLDMIEALFSEDWGRVVARVIASMRADAERMCTTLRCTQSCTRGEGACAIVGKLGRYSGLFAALAFESDPDRVAAAIDAAASPGGGYRRKMMPGVWTISLGSFPGLAGGTELRFGSYGGRQETGNKPYFAAPTLTLPVGIDFARGFGSHNVGLFLSAIDPAAYLQYDVVSGGKLPGAQLVTALAPGAWLHTSVFDSPFTLSLFGVFRPGLRADTSALSVPSAHALQFGVSASVDVTLFDLFSSAASVRK